MKNLIRFIIGRRSFTYNTNKIFFEGFENNNLYFFDIMFNLRYDIFSNYTLIEDKNNKEKYIKNQALYFQSMLYENDSTMFHDSWFIDDPIYHGQITITHEYIDFLLFHILSKIDTYSIPFNHDKNKLILIYVFMFYLMN